MTPAAGLQDVLAQAQVADPGRRILLRDSIAAHGESAIEAMTDWLADPGWPRPGEVSGG